MSNSTNSCSIWTHYTKPPSSLPLNWDTCFTLLRTINEWVKPRTLTLYEHTTHVFVFLFCFLSTTTEAKAHSTKTLYINNPRAIPIIPTIYTLLCLLSQGRSFTSGVQRWWSGGCGRARGCKVGRGGGYCRRRGRSRTHSRGPPGSCSWPRGTATAPASSSSSPSWLCLPSTAWQLIRPRAGFKPPRAQVIWSDDTFSTVW